MTGSFPKKRLLHRAVDYVDRRGAGQVADGDWELLKSRCARQAESSHHTPCDDRQETLDSYFPNVACAVTPAGLRPPLAGLGRVKPGLAEPLEQESRCNRKAPPDQGSFRFVAAGPTSGAGRQRGWKHERRSDGEGKATRVHHRDRPEKRKRRGGVPADGHPHRVVASGISSSPRHQKPRLLVGLVNRGGKNAGRPIPDMFEMGYGGGKLAHKRSPALPEKPGFLFASNCHQTSGFNRIGLLVAQNDGVACQVARQSG